MRRRWSVCVRPLRILLGFVTWAAICAPAPVLAQSETLTLIWDRNPEPDIDHYNVYVGSRPGTADVVHAVPASENGFAFTIAPGQVGYFSVTAVNTEGVEGLRSVELACAIPTLTQPADQGGVVGTAVAPLTLQASDPAGGLLTFTAAGLPSGVTINGATGVIKGIPTTAGTRVVTVSVNNGVLVATRSFTWTIAPSSTPPSLNTVSMSPDSGSGSSGTFTAVYSDSYGAADLSIVYLKFSTTPTGPSNTCMVSYSPADRQLSLRDDSGLVWQSATIGWGTLQNSQCSVNLAASAASSNGLTVSLTVSMVFKAAYAGVKNVYAYATSRNNVNTGWNTMGTWTIPVATVLSSLSTVSVVPNAGLGARQTFTAQFTDAFGASDIAYAYVKFATGASGASNTCMVRYDGAARTVSLRDDAGTWLPGQTPVLGTMQQNTQCSFYIRDSSVTLSGQTLTMTVSIGFSSAYAGDRNIYLYASSVRGAVTDWQWRGSWTVPAEGTDALSVGAVTPNAGVGIAQTFSAQYIDGFNDPLSLVYLRFGETSLGPQNTCMVRYDRFARLLSLRDDAGIWQPGVPFSSGGSQQNSQCVVSLAESSVSVVAGVLTLRVRVTFLPRYAGPKNVYLYAAGTSGRVTEWQQRGSWTIPSTGDDALVRVGDVTPNSGVGQTQMFTAQFADRLGAADLAAVHVTIGSSPGDTAGTCAIRFEPATGQLSLADDAGAWMPGVTFPDGAPLANSQCAVSLAGGSAVLEGEVLTLTVTVDFKPAYIGAKGIYLHASTRGGYVTEWQQRGTWEVPGATPTQPEEPPQVESPQAQP